MIVSPHRSQLSFPHGSLQSGLHTTPVPVSQSQLVRPDTSVVLVSGGEAATNTYKYDLSLIWYANTPVNSERVNTVELLETLDIGILDQYGE